VYNVFKGYFMKKAIFTILLMISLDKVFSLNNRLFLDGIFLPGAPSQSQRLNSNDSTGAGIGFNFGWNGMFPNSNESIYGSEFGQHNLGILTQFSYIHFLGKNDNFDAYKFGLGLTLGQYATWSLLPNIIYYDTLDSLSFNIDLGFTVNAYIKDFAIRIGLGFSIPVFKIYNNSNYDSFFHGYNSYGLTYDINRTKKRTEINYQRQQRKLQDQEEERILRIEAELVAHERMLQEKGITEEEWQNQEADRKRRAEVATREQTALSQLIQNLIDIGYNIGKPFQIGDIVSIPYGLFTAIDYSFDNDVNSYLVIMNDYNTPSKPFYIETTRQLNSIGPMRIEYLGAAQYLERRVPRSTLRFREVR
jgi:hypothetical protein